MTIVRTTNATMGTPTAMSAARTAPTDRRAVIATGSTRALPSASATIAATTAGMRPSVAALKSASSIAGPKIVRRPANTSPKASATARMPAQARM